MAGKVRAVLGGLMITPPENPLHPSLQTTHGRLGWWGRVRLAVQGGKFGCVCGGVRLAVGSGAPGWPMRTGLTGPGGPGAAMVVNFPP